ncbi:MAG: tetratricopeptide repeat protein [Candidatus Binataceae bacterium]
MELVPTSLAQGRLILAHLSEQNLPPEAGMPTGAPSPGAATSAVPGAQNPPIWTQSTGPNDEGSGTSNGESAPLSPAAQPTNGESSSETQSTPGANPPPALDASTVDLGPQLADQSLQPEIDAAGTPARAASLRLTEDARQRLHANQADDALRTLARAVSIDPANPYEYFFLGRAWMAKQNYEQALTFFKRAELGFSNMPEWLGETISDEGTCYEELDRDDDAFDAYRRALTAAPNNLKARIGLSRLGGTMTAETSLAQPPPATAGVAYGPGVDAAAPPPTVSDIAPAPAEQAPPSAAP